MMNKLGKGLILLHVTLCVLLMTWAAGLFLKFYDIGWKEPKKDLTFYIPSEIDQRVAAYYSVLRAKDAVTGPIKPAQDAWFEASNKYPENHEFYRKELERLRTAKDPIEIKTFEVKDTGIVTDTPGKPLGKPVLSQPVDGIDKSQEKLYAEMAESKAKLEELTKEIQTQIAKNASIDEKLKGTGDKPGIYQLLDEEAKIQEAIRFEREYLQPLWAGALEEARLFTERYERLKGTLDRLNQARQDQFKNKKKL
jgi:hypothetical protein